MGVYKEEYVVVRRGSKPSDPSEISINCPAQLGLAFDLARIVFEFGLYVTKGDISTDGRWCFVVFWVKPVATADAYSPIASSSTTSVEWSLLKQRLEDACPSALAPCWLPVVAPPVPESERMLLLSLCSLDRTGLLHGVAEELWKMELTIRRVQVSTTPDGKARDLFFVTYSRTQMALSKPREHEVKWKLEKFLGDEYSVCGISPVGPEYSCRVLNIFPQLDDAVAMEIFCDDPVAETSEQDRIAIGKAHTGAEEKPADPGVVVTVDNNTSPGHSLLQISCKNRKGLLYDCLRTVKDWNLKVAYGRIPSAEFEDCNSSELCLFVVDSNGKKITDAKEQNALVQFMQEEIGNPIRIKVRRKGIETKLLVACPIERSGRGRPLVFHDVTQALKVLGINIFKAELGRHEYNGKRWEIYEFLLADMDELSTLACCQMHYRIVDQVRQGLLGPF